ncbi:MAG: hypothetical protein QOH99_1097 [Frankiaceae bacterium]|jgi:hypothetical protein|nr:hypothetical protein [Frankiaceae bacterium]
MSAQSLTIFDHLASRSSHSSPAQSELINGLVDRIWLIEQARRVPAGDASAAMRCCCEFDELP